MKAGRIAACIVVALSLACSVRGGPDVDAHVANLSSEDPKVAEEARRYLEARGADVVPGLFDKLLVADWTLRPRLLEVLSANGREFAKQKLKNGSDTEKIYAALVYELTRAGEPDDYDTPEFKAMVEALLKAIKTEDKNLRAASIDALLHDPSNALAFRYYYDLVPAMILSFDVDLVIVRRTRAGGFVTLWNICMALEWLAGDRLAFLDSEPAMQQRAKESKVPVDATDTAQVQAFIEANRGAIEELRTELIQWWRAHSTKSIAEIGRLIIERDISILEREPSLDTERSRAAKGGLRSWTGEIRPRTATEWRAWWSEHQIDYRGPIEGQERKP